MVELDVHIVMADHVISPRLNQQAAENALKNVGRR
jgi:hypothetical protein